MNPVKVSLIIPMYNCEDYVEGLLDNLCSQDFSDMEILCVVDGSPDKTFELAKAYSENDSRIKVYRCEHKGAGAARNFGISEAKGEYLLFPDADDSYEPNYVSRLFEAIDNNQADIAVCQYINQDYHFGSRSLYGGYRCLFCKKDKAISPKSIPNITAANSNVAFNKIFRKSFVLSGGLRFSETKSINDLFFSAAALISAKSVVFIDDHLVTYNKFHNPQSISSSRGDNPQDVITVCREFYDWLEDRGLLDEHIRDYFWKWSVSLRDYAANSNDDRLVGYAVNEFVHSEPWKGMSGRELRYNSQLYTGLTRHRLKLAERKLAVSTISPESRGFLERLTHYLKRELHIYEEIMHVLRDDHDKDMEGSDSYAAFRLMQIKQTGFLGTMEIVYRKVLKKLL